METIGHCACYIFEIKLLYFVIIECYPLTMFSFMLSIKIKKDVAVHGNMISLQFKEFHHHYVRGNKIKGSIREKRSLTADIEY